MPIDYSKWDKLCDDYASSSDEDEKKNPEYGITKEQRRRNAYLQELLSGKTSNLDPIHNYKASNQNDQSPDVWSTAPELPHPSEVEDFTDFTDELEKLRSDLHPPALEKPGTDDVKDTEPVERLGGIQALNDQACAPIREKYKKLAEAGGSCKWALGALEEPGNGPTMVVLMERETGEIMAQRFFVEQPTAGAIEGYFEPFLAFKSVFQEISVPSTTSVPLFDAIVDTLKKHKVNLSLADEDDPIIAKWKADVQMYVPEDNRVVSKIAEACLSDVSTDQQQPEQTDTTERVSL